MRLARLVVPLALSGALLGGCYQVPTAPPPTETPTYAMVEVQIFFADIPRYVANTEPFETPVARILPDDGHLPEAALREYFRGPTVDEAARGLDPMTNGCTGFSQLTIENGIARVYLTGPCNSGGATFTIAGPLMATLLAFPEIEYVKLYDESGQTGDPDGFSNSIPSSLEP